MANEKFSQFTAAGSYASTDVCVGLVSGNNGQISFALLFGHVPVEIQSNFGMSLAGGITKVDNSGNMSTTATQGFMVTGNNGTAQLVGQNNVYYGYLILTDTSGSNGANIYTTSGGGVAIIGTDSNGNAFFQYAGSSSSFQIQQAGGSLGMLECGQLNSDGGNFTTDGNGDLTCSNVTCPGGNVECNILDLTGNGYVVNLNIMTSNSAATVTFNTNGQNETQYNTSSSTISSLTINLPSTSVTGQILRYVTKGVATTVTVNGTVDIGASVTTLAANASVAWQAINGSGAFVRLQ